MTFSNSVTFLSDLEDSIASPEESNDPLARPTNWRALMIPAPDWNHMKGLQKSIMTGAVSGDKLSDFRDLLRLCRPAMP